MAVSAVRIVRGERYVQQIETQKLLNGHRRHIRESLRKHGDEVQEELEKFVSTGSRSGRLYKFRGRSYTASAPGEPPAKRSGKLSRSFINRPRQWNLVIANTAFAKGAPYPLYLEEGTSRMKPRPYFLKTIIGLNADLYRELNDFPRNVIRL